MPLHPLSHGTVSWIKYLSVAQFRVRAHARLLSCAQPNCTRTLIHPFTKRPPPPSSELMDTLPPFLATSLSWDVYVDGSYPLPGSAESMSGDAKDHTGG